MASKRIIILHYHLFKNAGTSVDDILRRNVGARWVTREFPEIGGNNTALVEDWIRDTPEAIAYSSHTMLGAIPQVQGVRVISLALLRDPIARIRSAYRFERAQEAATWGTALARQHDLAGYINARLDRSGDRQCRNFQTYRLASLCPGEGSELERAMRALTTLTVAGRVEAFSEAMERLATAARPFLPDFTCADVRRNRGPGLAPDPLSDTALCRLTQSNEHDLRLIAALRHCTADQG